MADAFPEGGDKASEPAVEMLKENGSVAEELSTNNSAYRDEQFNILSKQLSLKQQREVLVTLDPRQKAVEPATATAEEYVQLHGQCQACQTRLDSQVRKLLELRGPIEAEKTGHEPADANHQHDSLELAVAIHRELEEHICAEEPPRLAVEQSESLERCRILEEFIAGKVELPSSERKGVEASIPREARERTEHLTREMVELNLPLPLDANLGIDGAFAEPSDDFSVVPQTPAPKNVDAEPRGCVESPRNEGFTQSRPCASGGKASDPERREPPMEGPGFRDSEASIPREAGERTDHLTREMVELNLLLPLDANLGIDGAFAEPSDDFSVVPQTPAPKNADAEPRGCVESPRNECFTKRPLEGPASSLSNAGPPSANSGTDGVAAELINEPLELPREIGPENADPDPALEPLTFQAVETAADLQVLATPCLNDCESITLWQMAVVIVVVGVIIGCHLLRGAQGSEPLLLVTRSDPVPQAVAQIVEILAENSTGAPTEAPSFPLTPNALVCAALKSQAAEVALQYASGVYAFLVGQGSRLNDLLWSSN